MTTALIYPATLPNLITAPVTPAERRLLSDVIGGPQQARGVQRDYLATRQVEWGPFTRAQAEEFERWWRETLVYGGAWFSATWVSPQGRVPLVYQFAAPPKWIYVADGIWRVSAPLHVRGRGSMEPTLLGSYMTWAGAEMWESNQNVAWCYQPDNSPGYAWRYIEGEQVSGSGKIYFEFLVQDATSSAVTPPGGYGFKDAIGVKWIFMNGNLYKSEVSSALLNVKGSYGFQDSQIDTTVRFALDLDSGDGWIGMGNSWASPSNPESGQQPNMVGIVGPIRLLGMGRSTFTDLALTIRSSASQMANAVPEGFHAIGADLTTGVILAKKKLPGWTSSTDWGTVLKGYAYETLNDAVRASEAAYYSIWPGNSRGTYFAVRVADTYADQNWYFASSPDGLPSGIGTSRHRRWPPIRATGQD